MRFCRPKELTKHNKRSSKTAMLVSGYSILDSGAGLKAGAQDEDKISRSCREPSGRQDLVYRVSRRH